MLDLGEGMRSLCAIASIEFDVILFYVVDFYGHCEYQRNNHVKTNVFYNINLQRHLYNGHFTS